MLWYCVCPVADRWCVTFDGQRRSFIYATEQEAIDAATDAARRNWEKHQVPSGVRIQDVGGWRQGEMFAYVPKRLPPEKRHTLPGVRRTR